MAVFDDGHGEALYVGGTFSRVENVAVSNIARWDGRQWSSVGGGVTSQGVNALKVFDDGSGAKLIVGGKFTAAGGAAIKHLARWDGAHWSAMGSLSGSFAEVAALESFDDGTGDALYVAGSFSQIGGVPASCIAKWNGTQWFPLGAGVGPSPAFVESLHAFADADGPALYAGGAFSTAGGIAAKGIARWNGSAWSSLAGGISDTSNSRVYALTSFNDASDGRPSLYACGRFESMGGVPASCIARWNGREWSDVGGGIAGGVGGAFTLAANAAAVYQGPGDAHPALYVGGGFETAGGIPVRSIARWDGDQWSSVDGGIGVMPNHGPPVAALFVRQVGGQARLLAGGQFAVAGSSGARSLASFDGAHWSPIGAGEGIVGAVHALSSVPLDGDNQVIAAGQFDAAGTVQANNIARWDGSAWHPLGVGITGPEPYYHDLAVFCATRTSDDSGENLYVGGVFRFAGGAPANNIARWDGTRWWPLGSGVSGHPFDPDLSASVYTLFAWPNGRGGSDVYVAGGFTQAGDVAASYVAKWDGTTWCALGAGTPGYVGAFAVFDYGGGPALYAGGSFSPASSSLARWDGSRWEFVENVNGWIVAVSVFDDGRGPALYIAGDFSSAGGVAANRVARWDGKSWTNLGAGLNGVIHEFHVLNDGTGPALFATGTFEVLSAPGARHVARLVEGTWTPVAGGTTSPGMIALIDAIVRGATGVSSGPAAGLYFGGYFTMTGSIPSNGFGRVECATPDANLDSDGHVNGVDLAMLLAHWSGAAFYAPCPPYDTADLNLDCRINGQDLAALLAAWSP